MVKNLVFVLALLVAAPSVMAQAYRWVDEDGVVQYSDRPQPGAERIDLPRANTTRIRPYTRPEPDPDDEAEPQAPFRYESLAVVSPAAEETLWNIEGILNVSLALTPSLRPGHQLRVYYDGQPVRTSGTSFQLEEVYRGEHNLQAEVLDEAGKVMIRSQPLRFYVQQSTVRF